MVLLKHRSYKSFQGTEFTFLLTLLLFFLFVGLSAAEGGVNSPHDLATHLEGAEINHVVSLPSVHSDYWCEGNRLSHKDRSYRTNSEKSIPPVELQLVNEPAGEDERKLLPILSAPFGHTVSKITKQRSIQSVTSGLSLVRDLTLQSLSTVILLN